jgi:hypothetical protein
MKAGGSAPPTSAPLTPASPAFVPLTPAPPTPASPTSARPDTFELRLRCAAIAMFGLLFPPSYIFALLMLFNDPYAQGLVNARLSDMGLQVGVFLFMAVLGVLMLTGVFKRKVFHALAGFVLVYQLYSLCAIVVRLNSDVWLSDLDILGGNNLIAWAIGSALGFGFPADILVVGMVNFIFWCAPFAIYYLILFIRKQLRRRHGEL